MKLGIALVLLGCGGAQVPRGQDFLIGAWRGAPFPRMARGCPLQMEFHADGWVETNLLAHDASCAFFQARYRQDPRVRQVKIGRLECRYLRDNERLRILCVGGPVPPYPQSVWVFDRVANLVREPRSPHDDLDPDHDGILWHEDRCPDFEEDRDGVEDSDGCPEGS